MTPVRFAFTMSDVTTTRQEATMTESVLIRTYELFDIEWERTDPSTGEKYRACWTGFHTAEEAQGYVDGSTDPGTVVRRTWDTIIPAGYENVYRPGCAERVEIVEVG